MGHKPRVIFLFPLVWRPEKANFALRFERLSVKAHGEIFTLSAARHRGLPIGRFRVFSERFRQGLLARFLSRLRLQLLLAIRVCRRGSVDCIVAYDPYGSGINGILLKYLLRARLVVELNGDHHQHAASGNGIKNWIMLRGFQASLRHADAIKVLNTDQERFVREALPGKPVYRFCDFVADSYFRTLHTYDGDYLLSVGHPFEPKGVREVILAFRRIVERHPHLRLRIMGHAEKDELSEFRALSANDPRIEFVPSGWIEDVGEQMRGCLALVNGAHFEAMGRVHLEAMACRKPVLTTRTNGGRDYIVDGETGLLCEIRNVDDLAAKMETLVGDPVRARAMGEAGLARLEKEYCEARYVERMCGMLREVIGSESNPDAAFADR
jgi:glycosyltransferase involved in cell wall biosynthesis